ncbi:Zuotin [Spiromyces aspiralis]|uniref:Zuotin n=1 Tax=Spiromyces aspiralis TaxID=68401 RepID=A0ACC1HGU7_9FUNG|nr:Zuotin [Spiromyces aspiralis]
MAAQAVEFTLPSLPSDVSAELSKVHSALSESKTLQIESAGLFAQTFRETHANNTDHLHYAKATGQLAGVQDSLASLRLNSDGEDNEEETEEMLTRDAKNWKEQDHYAVLGLSKLRWNATPDDITRQFRKKVLKHHPDKKASLTGNTNNDSFFKCIQKAYELLMDPVRRRQWDSVDPAVAIDIPNPKDLKTPEDFFGAYGPVFEREGRFALSGEPAPKLGDMNTPREEVEAFYEYWYRFESWRSFEYLDKEDAEGADNRDNKRYVEKKNKAQRAKLKKEDNARIHKLVTQAHKADPRMAKFKEEDKLRKNFKKIQREEEQRKAEEAKKKAEEEAQLAALKAEVEAKQAREVAKKDKEMIKRAVKKEKKTLKNLLKGNNYFVAGIDEVTPEQIATQLGRLDSLIAANKDVIALESVRVQLEAALSAGNVAEVFEKLTADLPPAFSD